VSHVDFAVGLGITATGVLAWQIPDRLRRAETVLKFRTQRIALVATLTLASVLVTLFEQHNVVQVLDMLTDEANQACAQQHAAVIASF
jgi:hypothetical protein